ncbi:MAG: UDP-N-acetylmuramate dehydrogenase [Patescibacteria group bacterium]
MESLKKIFGDRIRTDEPLSRHTNFRIGGPARYFFEARNSDEVAAGICAAVGENVPFFLLGGGSNILVSDKGFDGLVVKLANRAVSIEGTRVRAEAGMLSVLLARKTVEAGLAGFEWAVGLPGTVGGAVRGNAGCFGGEMKDVVREVEIVDLRNGCTTRTIAAAECEFGYRDSIFKHFKAPLAPSRGPTGSLAGDQSGSLGGGMGVVLSVTLDLSPGEKERGQALLRDYVSRRKEKQPTDYSSAGCVFKNISAKGGSAFGGEFIDEAVLEKLRKDTDVPEEFLKAGRIPAGWIIEQLGLKGTRIGEAMISEKHGNFIVNAGRATADEVVQLIVLVKSRAREMYGLQMQEEIQYVGFE